jgi:hypothetical protein
MPKISHPIFHGNRLKCAFNVKKGNFLGIDWYFGALDALGNPLKLPI